MAAVVARGSQLSSSLSLQEKGSRNKRKFHSDTPPPVSCKDCDTDINNCSKNRNDCSPSMAEFPNNEVPDGRSVNDLCPTQGNFCNMCGTVRQQIDLVKPASQSPRSAVAYNEASQRHKVQEESDGNYFHDADWGELTESELEELVLRNLDAIYQSAIKKIASCGFSLDVAKEAVLRCWRCYGSKDPVSNILHNVLAFLKSGQEKDSKDRRFQDLPQLEKHVLDEMVCVLREMRPFFSTGDALWCLLVCDMNVAHACAMDADTMGNFVVGENKEGFSLPAVPPLTNAKFVRLPISSSKSSQMNDNCGSPSVTPVVGGTTNLQASRVPSNSVSFNQTTECSDSSEKLLNDPGSSTFRLVAAMPKNEECVGDSSGSSFSLPKDPGSISKDHAKSSAQISLPDPKYALEAFRPDSHRRNHLNNFKRSDSRQKTGQYESGHRGSALKASLRSSKSNRHASPKWNHEFSSGATTAKYSPQEYVLPALGAAGPSLSTEKPNFVASAGLFGNAGFVQNAMSVPLASPMMSTDLSLSLTSKYEALESNPMVTGVKKELITCDCPPNSPCQFFGQNALPDGKDEKVLRLIHHARNLETELQQWTEWAQQKVMQAARRLSKDKAELKTLRQEKEEAVRMVKERQTLEENTLKKLSDMESAILKTTSHLRHATGNTHRLEIENLDLQKEMEAAKVHASEAATNCLEVSKREKKTLKRINSLGRQKELIQEELATEKRKQSHLQQQVLEAKESLTETEERWKQELKAKEEALTRANAEKEERRQLENASKLKEDAIHSNAETDYQQYRDNIRRLESEIAQLRLKCDSSKIAALRWGVDRSYASRLTTKQSIQKVNDSLPQLGYDLGDFQESPLGDVQRERECVMCLTEEMSVVFLPCAHQVVCLNCNVLHEKQGMKDCPSCRAPIQQRISVRFADY